MSKACIITMTEGNNYGQRLQNYALQQTLLKLGVDTVETPRNYCYNNPGNSRKYRIKTFIDGVLHGDRKKYCDIIKLRKFFKFNDTYVRPSPYYSTAYFISPELEREYDYFIIGSDQVWNPSWKQNWDFNFATFAPSEKRISYSASFGVDKVPEELTEDFTRYLSDMRAISVREYEGAEIVKDLTGRDASVLIDPTLLLTKSDWESIEKKPFHISKSKKYILTYYLGENAELQDIFKEIYASNPEYRELKVINLHNLNERLNFCIDPCEFIWLINHAQLFITDSFHGMVFATVMGTPFVPASRRDNQVSMNSRITSLFRILGLTFKSGIITQHIDKQAELCDNLRIKQSEALAFLSSALGPD